ncbi:hypothetical protein ACFX1S_042102 [Malus domestica]
MERSTSVRKPHTSTIDLLTWSETLPANSPLPSFAYRPHQPSDGDQKGGVWKAAHKMTEINGSGIFAQKAENDGEQGRPHREEGEGEGRGEAPAKEGEGQGVGER